MKAYESILDYSKLEEVTIVANTPTYLYLNFQKNQTILDFSCAFSDQELINIFYSEINEKRSFRNLVNLYACIVALSFKDSVYTYGFFKNLKNILDIKWASDLADIYFSRASYTSVPEVVIMPTLASEENKYQHIQFENLDFA